MNAAFRPDQGDEPDGLQQSSEVESDDDAETEPAMAVLTGYVDRNNPSRASSIPARDDNDLAALRSDLNNAFNAALGRGPS